MYRGHPEPSPKSQYCHEGEAVPCPSGQGDASHENVTVSGDCPCQPPAGLPGCPGSVGSQGQVCRSTGSSSCEALAQLARRGSDCRASRRLPKGERARMPRSGPHPLPETRAGRRRKPCRSGRARSTCGCEEPQRGGGAPRLRACSPHSGCTRTLQVCRSANEPPGHVCPEDQMTGVSCTAATEEAAGAWREPRAAAGGRRGARRKRSRWKPQQRTARH